MTTYLRDFSSYFDTGRLSVLPTSASCLTVEFGPGRRNTAVDAWHKRWKDWIVLWASTMNVACRELDSPYFRCYVKDEYQLILSALLAVVHRRYAVQRLVATELFCFAGSVGVAILCCQPSLHGQRFSLRSARAKSTGTVCGFAECLIILHARLGSF